MLVESIQVLSKNACVFLLVTRSHLLLLYIGDFARLGNRQMSIEEEHEEKMENPWKSVLSRKVTVSVLLSSLNRMYG